MNDLMDIQNHAQQIAEAIVAGWELMGNSDKKLVRS